MQRFKLCNRILTFIYMEKSSSIENTVRYAACCKKPVVNSCSLSLLGAAVIAAALGAMAWSR